MSTQTTVPAVGGAVIPPLQPAGEAPKSLDQTTSPETPTPDGQPDPAKTGAEDEGEKKSRFQGRISQLVQQRRDADARAAAAEEQARELARQLREIRSKPREDLDYDQREDLRLQTALDQRDMRSAQHQAEAARQEALTLSAQTLHAKLEAAADPDIKPFMEDETFPLTDHMIEFISDSDKAPELAKHLVQNPRVADQLARLTFRNARRSPTVEQLRAADRILLRLEAQLAVAPPAPRKTSNAPNPGTTLRGGQSVSEQPSLNEVDDMEAYAERRREMWKKGLA